MKTVGLSRRSSAIPRVVVAEPFAESGLAVLRASGIDVASCVGMDREHLAREIGNADGLIVRSETRVDRELLARGERLAVVARAGVGVDAIDVAAATEAGIVVLNTPGANTLAATEQTFALMLSLLRHTVAAAAALRAGRWERKPFIGTELHGKTLGLVGLGRIGTAVAFRARAFGMRTIAYDPFVSAARANAYDVELVRLDELLRTADVVTLHVPLTPQTRNLIDAPQLAVMKQTAVLINCARGGVVAEDALLAALDEGRIAGAALDVVAEEPPTSGGTASRLHAHAKVVATPHLGGSTHEALERIAVDLARDVVSVLLGAPATAAVNAAVPDGPEGERLRPFVDLAYRIGRLYPQLAEQPALPEFEVVLQGDVAEAAPEPVVNAFLTGLLQATSDRRVTIVNAERIAAELGVAVESRGDPRSDAFASALRVTGGTVSVTGTCSAAGPRLVEINGFEMDATPAGSLLMTKHRDVPGMIGKVGTILGNAHVNISTMQVSREDKGGNAIMILSIDREVEPPTLAALREIPGIQAVWPITL